MRPIADKRLQVKTEISVTAQATNHYRIRLQRVLQHIEEHLDEDLSVDALSGVAAFSRYHFHRQFSALFGIGVYRYVQLARLKRASYKLAFREDEPILQIAFDSGYEGPEAFARAFKKTFGQSPSAFRNEPQWTSWHAAHHPLSETRKIHMARTWTDGDVRIEDTDDIRVAELVHRGDPALIGDSVRRFIEWRKQTGIAKASAVFNILYDDPHTTPPEDFRLGICVATDRDVAPNDAGIAGRGRSRAGAMRCCAMSAPRTASAPPSSISMEPGCRKAERSRGTARSIARGSGSSRMCPSTRR